MKKYLSLLIVLIVVSCNQTDNTSNSKDLVYDINGNWCFLNKGGVYTESSFTKDFFQVYNQQYGLSPEFKYYIKDDTLYTTFNTGKKIKTQKSVISWIDENKVVLRTYSGADSMERIIDGNYLLGNINMKADSINFIEAFGNRNDNYLIQRGVLTKEEVEAFRKDQVIPEDVQEKLKK